MCYAKTVFTGANTNSNSQVLSYCAAKGKDSTFVRCRRMGCHVCNIIINMTFYLNKNE